MSSEKVIRINYIVSNVLYIKCIRIEVHLYDELNDPVDYFTSLLAYQKNISKDNVIIELLMVCDSNDNIERIFKRLKK